MKLNPQKDNLRFKIYWWNFSYIEHRKFSLINSILKNYYCRVYVLIFKNIQIYEYASLYELICKYVSEPFNWSSDHSYSSFIRGRNLIWKDLDPLASIVTCQCVNFNQISYVLPSQSTPPPQKKEWTWFYFTL